jgi:NAD-dependent deacetylase
MQSFDERLKRAVMLLNGSEQLVAFTGAGISTESGLSDFRSPGGVWDRYRIVTYQEFLLSHDARVEYWNMKREFYNELESSQPNKAHFALAALEKIGKLACLITQNIDGFHQDSGSSQDIVIELHGTNRKAICVQCGNLWPIEEIQVRLESGDLDPQCEHCAGFIKPATVSFGQAMPETEMRRAYECASKCDLFLMVGSSLQVEPAASIPRVAHAAGAQLLFINRTNTPWDHLASVVFRENAGDVLHEIVENLKHGM